MDATRFQTLTTQGGILDLTPRARWQLSGADRVRYLNGQVTQDVRRANSAETLYACVTNAKGRIEGDVFIHAAPDGQSLLIDAAPELRETLGLRLEKYIIADDAVLEDVTDAWQLWHAFGSQSLPEIAEGHRVKSQRLGFPGVDLWLPAGLAYAPEAGEQVSAEEAESLRVLQQVPAYPQELNGDTFPQEAGLETRAMSYTKGCYIGQEVLSRIKTTGKMPRQMIAWESLGEEPVSVGEHLWNAEGRSIGTLTSLTRHPLTQRQVGLAFVKQGQAIPDSGLLVGGDLPRIGTRIHFLSTLTP